MATSLLFGLKVLSLERRLMKKQQTITSLPQSPDQERRSRMIKYAITMGIRFACFILVFVVQGWWQIVMIVAAIILPYIAVVLANVGTNTANATVERPGAIVPIVAPEKGDRS
jgi:predicted tellurium resistance membrane protein TerC